MQAEGESFERSVGTRSREESTRVSSSEDDNYGESCSKKRRISAALKSQSTHSSSLLLFILLESHLCIGTGLTLVNQAAMAHTRMLATHCQTIVRFLRRCVAVGSMYYEDRAATFQGPLEIGRAMDNDIIMVCVSYSLNYPVDDQYAEHESAVTLASNITNWFQNHSNSPYPYLLPSGLLVDTTSLQDVNTIQVAFVRGLVLREFLKYNSLWDSLAGSLEDDETLCWWIVTTDEVSTYGEQKGDVSIYVHRSLEHAVACETDRRQQHEW